MAKKQITNELLNLVRHGCGCNIQFNNCPCNSCFHTWACEELGDNMGHLFWILILGIRGDYKPKDLITALEDSLNDFKKGGIQNKITKIAKKHKQKIK